VEYQDWFAVVRFDPWGVGTSDFDPSLSYTIKELLPTYEEAQHEVERLIQLRPDTESKYFSVHVKVYPEGRGFVSSD